MLRRVKIKNYKSLKDVDIKINDLSVLFGPNSAGKSNFLDALQLLSRITTSKTLKDAFESPYRGKPLESITFGDNGVADVLAKEFASFIIEIDVDLSDQLIDRGNKQIPEMRRPDDNAVDISKTQTTVAVVRERSLRYRIEVQIMPRSGVIRVADEKLVALNSKGEETGSRKAFLERVNNRLHLRMEGQAHPSYFDLYLNHSILSTNLYAPHYPHMVAMREELSEWFFFYLEPRERMRAASAVKEALSIGTMGEDLSSFLNTLKANSPRRFQACVRGLHAIIPSIRNLEVEVNAKGEVELYVLESNRRIPASVISEGTLRIIGLLALNSAETRPSVIGFEEPENGIHPSRIKLVSTWLNNLGGNSTTLIVTTHSPRIIDLVPSRSLYVVNKLEGNTQIQSLQSTLGELGRPRDVDDALDDVPTIPVSTRVLRGDYDAA